MTITKLPGEIVVPTRDREIERWKRSHRLRLPGVDTGTGTEPDKQERVLFFFGMAIKSFILTRRSDVISSTVFPSFSHCIADPVSARNIQYFR